MKLNDGKTFPYGYGWQTGQLRGHRYLGHGGGINGFSSFILRLVQDKLTVIVLINSGANPQSIAASVGRPIYLGAHVQFHQSDARHRPEIDRAVEAMPFGNGGEEGFTNPYARVPREFQQVAPATCRAAEECETG